MTRITMIGTGYVGLVTAACFAEVGHEVVCLDIDERKVALLNSSEIPIHETGLESLVARNRAAGRLRFTCEAADAVPHGQVQFIAVGTPPGEDGSADLRYVLQAARTIGRHITASTIVVDKSTVPVGTAVAVRAAIRSALAERGASIEFNVVSNPEFLREGAAIDDFMQPDRVIIGSDSEKATQVMRTVYEPFQGLSDRMIVMDVRSAELTKYAANAMLATRISFMNELANLAERIGADIDYVRRGIGADRRIGHSFLFPGAGYGGSCFPKDIKALIHTAANCGLTLELACAVERVNERQKALLGQKIVRRFGEHLGDRHFAVWGLAFKPDTNDMREAPSCVLIGSLLDRGASVTAYDPVAIPEARRIFGPHPRIAYVNDPMTALRNADGLAIVTEWREFRRPDFRAVRAALRTPAIFDGRNLYEPAEVRAAGLEYYPLGRARVQQQPAIPSRGRAHNVNTIFAENVLAVPRTAS